MGDDEHFAGWRRAHSNCGDRVWPEGRSWWKPDRVGILCNARRPTLPYNEKQERHGSASRSEVMHAPQHLPPE
jgi:hypothetical protein